MNSIALWGGGGLKMENNKVYILMDSNDNTDSRAILGVFTTLGKAKLALADYVLEKTSGGIDYIEIAEFKVIE